MTALAMLDTLTRDVRRLLDDEQGSTAVEYAIVGAGVMVAIAGTIWNLGAEVKTQLYDKIAALF